VSLEKILRFGTKIQLNKKENGEDAFLTLFHHCIREYQELPAGIPYTVVIEPTLPILRYAQWETQRKGQQLKRSLCSRGSSRTLNNSRH
jgi:hypothetical protein